METISKSGEIWNRNILEHNQILASEHFPKFKNHFDTFYYEWSGLELGFKPSAIFYPRKSEIDNFLTILEDKGYFF